MSLIGNVFKPLAKSVLIPLGFTAGPLATAAAIYKNKCKGTTRAGKSF